MNRDSYAGSIKKISVVLALILIAYLLYPRTYLASPRWQVQVVDQQGKPLSGITVNETWQNYSVESESRQQNLVSDARGFVEFPAREAKSSTLRRIFFTLRTARAGVHASFGPNVYVFVIGPGLEEHGYVDYWTGAPREMQSRIVMLHR